MTNQKLSITSRDRLPTNHKTHLHSGVGVGEVPTQDVVEGEDVVLVDGGSEGELTLAGNPVNCVIYHATT